MHQGLLANSKCPKDEVFYEKFKIGIARGKPMVLLRHGKSSFGERETLGWAQHYFSNDLARFPSHKKSKVIYEGMKSREC